MGKIIKILIIGIFLLFPIKIWAEEFEYEGLFYNVLSEKEKTVEVKGCKEPVDILVIPGEAYYNGLKYKVVQIGYRAFVNKIFSDIKFPDSITSIESYAFENCIIRCDYFYLPSKLKSLNYYSFRYCHLENVVIPSTLIEIDGDNFYGSVIQNYLVNEKNLKYTSRDGIIYNRNYNTLILAPSGKLEVNILAGIKIIKGNAFLLSHVQKVQLPESLTEIGGFAFYGASITSVTIPKNITYIGYNAFCQDENSNYSPMKTVTILNSNFRMEITAFNGLPSLEKVIIYGNSIPETLINSEKTPIPAFKDSRNAILFVEENLIHEYEDSRWWYRFKEILPLSMASATSLSEAENEIYRVYDLRGINILNTKDKSEINNLTHGLYIINGKKVKL